MSLLSADKNAIRLSKRSVSKIVGGLTIIIVALLWGFEVIIPDQLDYTVPNLSKVAAFETSLLYFFVHGFTMIPVFLLSFDKKVHFYKKWKYLFPAIGIVAFFFIVWDVVFTQAGVWGFNESYYLKATALLGLPLEEWLFFFSVPYASVFIYECLKCYKVPDYWHKADQWISYSLAGIFLLIGLLSIGKAYTSITFVLCAGYILWHFMAHQNTYRTRFFFAFFITLIPFLIVDGVLTGAASAAPVVLYNPEEFLGLRILSIPIEDAVYGFLMVFAIVDLFEKFRAKT